MMRVDRQPAPADFEGKVGKKGKRVLTKHGPQSPVPAKFWHKKEHWRGALDDLMQSYHRLCAFSAVRIERVTGARSVEHFRPKTKYPELAYSWENFRLVCTLMNGRKGDHEDVLDPFGLPANVFNLEPLTGKVVIHLECPASVRKNAQSTIERLRLNDPDCMLLRQEHLEKIGNKDWSLVEARRQRPFIVDCLQQQGLL